MIKKFIRNKIREDLNYKELIKGSFDSFVFKLFGVIFGYIFALLISRLYGAGAMGVFSLFIAVLQIFVVIGKLGFDNALLKLISQYQYLGKVNNSKEAYFKSIYVVVPVSLGLSVVCYFYSPYLADSILKKPDLLIPFRMISFLLLPLCLFSLNIESIRALKCSKEYSFLKNSFAYMLGCVVLLILYYLQYTNNLMPVITYSGAMLVGFLLSGYVFFKKVKFYHVKTSSDISFKSLFALSFPMMVTASLSFITHYTDVLMLGYFLKEEDVGIYNIAFRMANINIIFLFSINAIAAPKFAEHYAKDDLKGLEKTVRQSTKLIFLCSLPGILIMFIAPKLILGVFGEQFTTGYIVLIILSFGKFISAASGSVGNLLQMTNKHKMFQYFSIITTLSNILLNYLLIPRYGINGASFASMFSLVALNIVCVFYIRKHYKINTFFVPFIKMRNF